MKNITKETREGLQVTIPQSENAAEFDQIAKREGACHDEGSANVWYRGVFPDFHYWMCVALCQKFGIKRPMVDNKEGKTYKEGDRKGQVIQVNQHSDPEFQKFVAAQQNTTVPTFQSIATAICEMVGPVEKVFGTDYDLAAGERLVAFDPSASEPRVKSNEPGRDDLLTAEGLIAQTPRALKKSLGKITEVTKVEVALVDDSNPDAPAKNLRIVALAVKAYKKAVAEAAKAELMG